MTVQLAPGNPAVAGSRVSSFIKNEALRRGKRHSGLRTFLLPLGGASIAVAWAAVFGFNWLEVALLAGMFVLVTLGLEVGFHRLFAHHAFKAPRAVQSILWVLALMAGQGRGLYWMASHRRHHSFSDTPDDPHTPYFRVTGQGTEILSGLRGFWHAHQGNTYTDYATNVAAFANDIKRNEALMRLDKMYSFWVTMGIAIPGLVGALYYGTWMGAVSCALWGGPLRMFVQHQLFFTNASLAHMVGEQPFDTGDRSRNNWYCAIWTFGSALQNTHHAFPSSAYLRLRWYELDVAGMAIRVMASFGLATDVRCPSPENVRAKLHKQGTVMTGLAKSASGSARELSNAPAAKT